MNEWDYHYKQLNKADPVVDEPEDNLVHAVWGAIWMVVAIGITTSAIFAGAQWLGIM